MYAHDNNDFYPDKLKILSHHRKECGNIFHCPGVKAEGKKVFSDYIYHGQGKKASDPVFVLLEDKNENHRSNFKNRLMSDNEVVLTEKIE